MTSSGGFAGISVAALGRRFGELQALDDVSFTVPAGQLVGFVGANGAGKTTTMRIIMGVLAPSAGVVRWGEQPITTADRRRFGYMPEERGLYPKQKVLEQLSYLGELKGLTAERARTEAAGYLERFGLGERAKDPVEKLSLGNQQRAQIAAALIASPAALILDEPFSGLDPSAVDDMTAVLREQAARGVPVLFSSHQLDLVERLCDSLIILAGGTVKACGTVADLRASGPRRHRLRLADDAQWVSEWPGIQVVQVQGGEVLLADADPRGEEVGRLLAEAARRSRILEFTPVTTSLSELYREVTA